VDAPAGTDASPFAAKYKVVNSDEEAITFGKENQGPQTPIMDMCKLFLCCTGPADDRAIAHKYQKMGPGDYWHVNMRIQNDLKTQFAHDSRAGAKSKKRANNGKIDPKNPTNILRWFPAILLRVYEDEAIPHEDETEAEGKPAVLVWTTKKLITDNKNFVRKLKEKYGKDWVAFLLADDFCFDHELRSLNSLGSSISDPSYRPSERTSEREPTLQGLGEQEGENELEEESAATPAESENGTKDSSDSGGGDGGAVGGLGDAGGGDGAGGDDPAVNGTAMSVVPKT